MELQGMLQQRLLKIFKNRTDNEKHAQRENAMFTPQNELGLPFNFGSLDAQGKDLISFFSTRLIFPRSPQKVGAKSEPFLQTSLIGVITTITLGIRSYLLPRFSSGRKSFFSAPRPPTDGEQLSQAAPELRNNLKGSTRGNLC
ncbi:conserved hypothetical protein [Histoplasma mississippiense (nom. inval.)]|uniref:conserved hypothetical protein n=1 Tax=Ajellomyces capsulatus (strain NAm1 / WU24) TaxID=2059318 RepID=UPI000157BC28|nr:conserved hypothetical protein [Histoplasma mississippiense (nom. inval.)]EDN05859.1 conserved hypothetical protein [Histoplasma mississippiense (nom. inval.)]